MGLLRPVWSSRLPRLPPLRRRSGSSAWTACARAARTTRRPTTVFGGRPVAHRRRHLDPDRRQRPALPGRAGQAVPSPTTGDCSGTRSSARAGPMQGIAVRPVVPADHVGVPAARRRADSAASASSTSCSTCGRCGAVGTEPGAAARPGPLHHRLPAQRHRRRRRVLPDRPARPCSRSAPAAPSSACSAPGSWSSRQLQLDSRGILVLIAINLAFSFIYRGDDRLAGPRGRADRGRADHRRLRLRAAQEPDCSSRSPPRVAILAILVVIVVLRTSHLTAESSQALTSAEPNH